MRPHPAIKISLSMTNNLLHKTQKLTPGEFSIYSSNLHNASLSRIKYTANNTKLRLWNKIKFINSLVYVVYELQSKYPDKQTIRITKEINQFIHAFAYFTLFFRSNNPTQYANIPTLKHRNVRIHITLYA